MLDVARARAPTFTGGRKIMTPLFTTFAELLARRFAQLRGQAQAGQTLVEYALLLTMISLGCVAALLAINGSLNGFFQTVANAL
jgi:Flp pilus assembly pilin Flp